MPFSPCSHWAGLAGQELLWCLSGCISASAAYFTSWSWSAQSNKIAPHIICKIFVCSLCNSLGVVWLPPNLSLPPSHSSSVVRYFQCLKRNAHIKRYGILQYSNSYVPSDVMSTAVKHTSFSFALLLSQSSSQSHILFYSILIVLVVFLFDSLCKLFVAFVVFLRKQHKRVKMNLPRSI